MTTFGYNELMTTQETTTPKLVREYMQLHVQGSHARLSDASHARLGEVVDELRARGVLDW